MKRLIPFLLLAAFALSGCSGLAPRDSASQGRTGADPYGPALAAPQSPWANDPYFIAPPG